MKKTLMMKSRILNTFSNYTNTIIESKIVQSLTSLDKKIVIVASSIFVLAAALFYLFYQHFCKYSSQTALEQKSPHSPPSNAEDPLEMQNHVNFNSDFQSALAKDIVHSMEEQNYKNLRKILERQSKDDLSQALLEQDSKKQANLLTYAAHNNDLNAIDLICSVIETDLLKKILVQKDKHEWTALHHLALMSDNGQRYKALKKRAAIDSKKVSKFFCESPYMLRKYIRQDAGRFSTLSDKKPMGIYFKEANLDNADEQYIPYKVFAQKHGHLFSRPPECFKSIPQLRPEFLRALWEDMSDKIKRDESRVQQIDDHLKDILAGGEEKGIYLAPIKFNDKGESLPEEINVGIGGLARKDFKHQNIVTLYGGEYFTKKFPEPNDRSRDYMFTIHPEGTVDAVNVRSYGASFAHSAPNIRFEQIPSMLGFSFVSMTANEDIHENELLCLSYGPDYFKSRNIIPLETRPAAREQMEKNPSPHPDAKWRQECYLKIQARLS